MNRDSLSPAQSSVARALAAALAAFFSFEFIRLCTQGHAWTLWLIDWRGLPSPAAALLSLFCAVALTAFAAKPARPARTLALGAVLLIGITSLFDALRFGLLLADRSISSAFPVPFSLLVLAAVVCIARDACRHESRPRLHRPLFAATFAVALLGFPLAQMLTFGRTDYRRPADAILVFGAGVHADGTPSSALSDRVLTACQLYRDGLAPTLVFSGGPGPGPTSEPDAMRSLALSLGVPDHAIVLDQHGVHTQESISNTAALARSLHWSRVLGVSHFYHLPRIKLESQHAGLDLCTVPAPQHATMTALPWFMAREVAACWTHYLRGLG